MRTYVFAALVAGALAAPAMAQDKAPFTGVRIFVTDRLSLRGEARVAFWKLKYPTTFEGEPPLEPGTPGHSNAVITDGQLNEWTTSSWLMVGLG